MCYAPFPLSDGDVMITRSLLSNRLASLKHGYRTHSKFHYCFRSVETVLRKYYEPNLVMSRSLCGNESLLSARTAVWSMPVDLTEWENDNDSQNQCESMRITINTLIFIYLCHLALDHQRGKTLFLYDSRWFSNKCEIDSQWFSLILESVWNWFSLILSDSCWFSLILGDSRQFLMILE